MVLVAPDGTFPLCSYKSKLLTPKSKTYHRHRPDGLYPLRGDKPALRAKTVC